MANAFHSVTLIDEWCKGCTNCIKRCPTEAIRVRKGKAEIMTLRCIDCGECIRICPHHAKKAVYDSMDILNKYKYTIALPAPSLYGQFSKLESMKELDNALKTLGFDEVYQVAKAAELVSDATAKYIAERKSTGPIISSACPTITRLIQIRFPDLIENILPVITPSEMAGMMAKKEAAEKTGLKPSEIGAIFISPCPAKVTTINNPLGIEKSNLDGAIAIKEIYPLLVNLLNKNETEATGNSQTGSMGLAWGCSGGEASATLDDKYLAADGIENCIRVLESLENENLDVEFIELNACPGGCVGGVLTVENPFISMVKLKSLRKGLPPVCNKLDDGLPEYMTWNKPVDYRPVLELDSNISNAMEKLAEIDNITNKLMGLDCGSCGSPSCRAFAEDIVRGYASMNDCIFVLRESMHNIAQTLANLSSWEDEEK
ncbi:4Fe-4S binding protein [Tyzzerella sp. OttesenSCG-928-J15]|nr:4Fe-4S binding protein [Tyzzerella sp. OttesenSCG-928-J15]